MNIHVYAYICTCAYIHAYNIHILTHIKICVYTYTHKIVDNTHKKPHTTHKSDVDKRHATKET